MNSFEKKSRKSFRAGKKIVSICKRDPAAVPPFLSALRGLASLGYQTCLFVYYLPDNEILELQRFDVEVKRFSRTPYPQSFVQRSIRTLLFRIAALKYFYQSKPDALWWGIQDLPEIREYARIKKVPQIMQMHELESNRFRWCRRVGIVTVPEINRAYITQFLARLDKCPCLLPNIPWPTTQLEQLDTGEEKLTRLKAAGNKLVIYPGFIHQEKRCLSQVVKSLKFLPENVHLVLLPCKTSPGIEVKNLVNTIEKEGLSHRVHWLENRPAPRHLAVLSLADSGIGLYRPISLNQIYCAPNRIYEFTSLGIPVVLPDFPGISMLAIRGGIQRCNPDSPEQIASANIEITTRRRKIERIAMV